MTKNINIGNEIRKKLLKKFSDVYLIDSSEVIIIITPRRNNKYVNLLNLNSSFDLVINKQAIKESIGK